MYKFPKLEFIDKVEFSKDQALLLVGLWFIISVLNILMSCLCFDITRTSFNLERDVENLRLIQKGQVSRDSDPELYEMEIPELGSYSD